MLRRRQNPPALRLLSHLAVYIAAACGGRAQAPTAPSSSATSTPAPQVAAAPFAPASALDESPIPAATVAPVYSSSLPDETVIQVSAPGYISLRTRAGHLRKKQGRIFLVPSSDSFRQYLVLLYGSLASSLTGRLLHWDRPNIGVETLAPLDTDSAVAAGREQGLARFNAYLQQVHSAVRLTAVPRGDLRVDARGSGWGCGALRIDGERTNCTFSFLNTDEARMPNVWVRGLTLVVGSQGTPSGLGLLGRTDYTRFQDLNAFELAVLRTYFNRCHGARLQDTLVELEDDISICWIP